MNPSDFTNGGRVGYACNSSVRNLEVSDVEYSFLSDANGAGTFCVRVPAAEGGCIEKSIFGFFPEYSCRMTDEAYFHKTYEMLSGNDLSDEDSAFLGSDMVSKAPDLLKDNANFDFLAKAISSILASDNAVYLSVPKAERIIWLEAILTSLPLCLANRISYLVSDSFKPEFVDQEYDLVLMSDDSSGMANSLSAFGKKFLSPHDHAVPDVDASEADGTGKGYFLAIGNRSENLRDYNSFIENSSFRSLGIELAESYDMFVYLFKTDPMTWEHDRLLVNLNLYYKDFSDSPESESLAKEVLDFFIYSYGEPSDEEFMKGYVEYLDNENLVYFISAILRKKKKSGAYELMFDVLSDYAFSFTKCMFIPADIRSLLLQYAEEINKEPNNIRFVDFLSGLDYCAADELKSRLIELGSSGFDYCRIKYFNSLKHLGFLFDLVISRRNIECDAYLISVFFPFSQNEKAQGEFADAFFMRFMSEYADSGEKEVRRQLSDLLSVMADDDFRFFDEESSGRKARLKMIKSNLLEAIFSKCEVPAVDRMIMGMPKLKNPMNALWSKIIGLIREKKEAVFGQALEQEE